MSEDSTLYVRRYYLNFSFFILSYCGFRKIVLIFSTTLKFVYQVVTCELQTCVLQLTKTVLQLFEYKH